MINYTSNKKDGQMSIQFSPEDQVIDNRKRFVEKHGFKLEDCVLLLPEHKDKIKMAVGKEVIADAVVTDKEGVVLFLLTADCLPITFYDPVKKVVALAHLGWQPTDLELSRKVVEYLVDNYRSNPSDLEVIIGPGAGPGYCYESVQQEDNPRWRPYLNYRNGLVCVDFKKFNYDQLIKAGVTKIEVSDIDTVTDENYFSHYREGSGRMATIVAL
jgi:polyphenol oxidase